MNIKNIMIKLTIMININNMKFMNLINYTNSMNIINIMNIINWKSKKKKTQTERELKNSNIFKTKRTEIANGENTQTYIVTKIKNSKGIKPHELNFWQILISEEKNFT